MVFKLITYPNKTNEIPKFYIQMKGLHSGRPMKAPIKNCVAVYTDIPFLFEVVFALWKGRFFEPHLCGSCCPFIKINDVKNVVNIGLRHYKGEKGNLLKQVNGIDVLVSISKDKIKTLQTLQIHLCRAYFK